MLLWRAINAYLRGETPDVCAHEWLGAIASSIPKQLAALLVTEFRPIACICAKYSILLKILDVRLNHAVEDNGIIDDAQEAFRPGRSPKRQLAKVHNILHHQRKRQESLSVILYLDIKNAFKGEKEVLTALKENLAHNDTEESYEDYDEDDADEEWD